MGQKEDLMKNNKKETIKCGICGKKIELKKSVNYSTCPDRVYLSCRKCFNKND